MPEQLTSALEFFRTAWSQLSDVFPKVATALLLLIAGWLVAKLMRKLLIRLM